MKLDRAKAFWASTPTAQTGEQERRTARFVSGFLWPAFALGLGLLATVAWIAVLGWLMYRAVQLLGFV